MTAAPRCVCEVPPACDWTPPAGGTGWRRCVDPACTCPAHGRLAHVVPCAGCWRCADDAEEAPA